MYDEFDNKENEDRYDPKQPSAEDEVKTGQMYGEEDQLSETEEVQASTAEETEASAESGEQSSVYHYSYERGEQAEPTGNTQNSQQYGSSEHHAEEHINEEKKGYRQYYQNGEYHQREDGWHDGVYQNHPQQKHSLESGGKKPFGTGKKIAVAFGCAAVFGLVLGVTFGTIDSKKSVSSLVAESETISSSETEQRAELQTQAAGDADNSQSVTQSVSAAGDVSEIAENAMPSIVAITNKGVEEVQSMFFGTTQYQETESAGSGVIIAKTDKELLIATNNHVVDGAEELSVCFTVDTENTDDAVVKAQVKGTDSDHDLAVVAVSLSDISEDVKSKLKVAVMGDSDKLKIGNQVIAIGNALGYGQSLTVGYISALNREVTIDNVSNNMIQTDAAINFGNSGGALLDANGNLIGINSAKAADTGVEGMGYAIPINTASPILDELMNRTTRAKVTDSEELGFLGVDARDVSEEARQIYNLPAGAFVYSVVEGSPAEKAGIKKGDIITKLDGITISSRSELFSRMEYYKAGETIDVVVKTAQGGEYVENTFSVTLAKKSEYTSSSDGSSDSSGSQSQDQGNSQDNSQGQDNGQSQPRQYYEYDGNGSDGYSGNGGNSGSNSYDSLEDFFRQFQQ